MTKHPNAIMLFAAGFGTRMGVLTQDRPKPLIQVANRPLIDHALNLVDDIKPNRIVANLHYKAEMLADHLAAKSVKLSHEQPDVLETGGGLRAALPLLGAGPVYTLNPDAIWVGPNPLQLLKDAWDPDEMDGLLVCIPTAKAKGFQQDGDFDVDAAGHISRGSQAVYCGAQIIKTEGLYEFEQAAFSLNLLWDQMLRKNKLFALNYPGQWCDVGNPDGLALAESMLENSDV
ncbi:MAG: nucleotidyltransferase family protein [Rhodobacteraceae bacterium]|nr:nucleotidyltransferase family protein [Paracoccaceae bacterium]